MAATIPTRLPSRFRAGATLQATITLPDYPASDGWSLSYVFRGGGSSITFDASAIGSDHSISVGAAVTALWLPGIYRGYGRVSKSGDSFDLPILTIEILPDLSQQPERFDTRTEARKTLDAINAVLAKKATSDILNHTVAGIAIGRMPVEQLLMLKDRYVAEVQREEAAERISQGLGTGRNIFTRFTPTR